GMRVQCRDAEWLVKQVSEATVFGGGSRLVRCVGTDSLVRGHEAVFLTALDTLSPVRPEETKLVPDTSSGYQKALLYLEASLRQMPLTGVEPDLLNMGVFDEMEFQRRAVRHALSQPRVRLLLADDVGLGKTIQVGMILSELARRGRAARVLVLAKKSMLAQFQSELWNRFAFPLTRLDSTGIQKLRSRIPLNKNPFEIFHRVIISIDTVKTLQYRNFLQSTRWDVVVIDEAHNVAGANVPDKHLSHRLARILSQRCENLLLTTATPHNGKAETFGRLISLLDPSAIADPDLKEYTAEEIEDFFIMRFKEDVRADLGELLPERDVIPPAQTTVSVSEEEERVFSALAKLRTYAKERARANRLLEYGIYKLFLSSPDACRSSVEKRLASLKGKDPKNPELEHLTAVQDALGKQRLEDSSRFKLLLRELEVIGADSSDGSPRVVIFTESRVTQLALVKALAGHFGIKKISLKHDEQHTQKVAMIDGSFNDENQSRLIEAFSTSHSPIRLLVATDVASEGINLHHQCHHLIHYDLPWSIITTIQRNGRIDRLGQKHRPQIRYLMVRSENKEFHGDYQILSRLLEKVEEINRVSRSGDSVLKLYDAEKEEEYIARHGMLDGDSEIFEHPKDGQEASLEATIEAARHLRDEDFLRSLTEEETSAAEVQVTSRLRLFSDSEYFLKGYEYLRVAGSTGSVANGSSSYLPIEQTAQLHVLQAPKDLLRYLGRTDSKNDVIFGATAIPDEAFLDASSEFRLTDKPARVKLAIEAAKNRPAGSEKRAGYWSSETLITDQHPILKWIGERLLMLHRRGEAPYITSQALLPGELIFAFIGQLSSRAGTPMIASAHAVSFRPSTDGQSGGTTLEPVVEPLASALTRAKLESL
ncbi:MAG: DEAD/DEAH box helicase, partial [Bdellovibrionales bacterium]|nr:DEAD/DEAH box helicase [Bdellovibrionales bacterium]